MPIGDMIEIKSLCAKALIKDIAGADITATVYSDAQERGDSRVLLETGVQWDPLNALYPSAQEAAEYFAAYYVLKRYHSNNKDSQTYALEYYHVAMDICNSLAHSSTEGLTILAKPYKSYPLNPNASYYRSLPAGTSDVEDSTLGG